MQTLLDGSVLLNGRPPSHSFLHVKAECSLPDFSGSQVCASEWPTGLLERTPVPPPVPPL